MKYLSYFGLVLVIGISNAFVPTFSTRRHAMTMRKGRKSLGKTIDDSKKTSSPRKNNENAMSSASSSSRRTNWVPVAGLKSSSDLPTQDGKVKLVDTMADSLMNAATNPTGAVSVVTYDGRTYCFSSSCTSCKVPMGKAKMLPPNEETGNVDARVSCDLCAATFNARTGDVLESAESTGFLGGLVKTVMSASGKEPLPTYELGEKNGQIVINLA